MSKNQNINLFGLDIYSGSEIKLVHHVLSESSGFVPILIFTPNPEQLMLAKKDRVFFTLLQQADILIPDGIGVVLASRVMYGNTGIQERITGRDLMESLLAAANRDAKTPKSVLLLGSTEEVGEKAANVLQKRYSRLEIVSSFGYADVSDPTENEEREVQNFILQTKPDIVFVAFGAPHQEKWVIEHRELLKSAGTKVVLVVGGALDMIAGRITRAPQAVQSLHLEWLWRLIQEPKRWKRQLVLPIFGLMAVWEAIKYRFSKVI